VADQRSMSSLIHSRGRSGPRASRTSTRQVPESRSRSNGPLSMLWQRGDAGLVRDVHDPPERHRAHCGVFVRTGAVCRLAGGCGGRRGLPTALGPPGRHGQPTADARDAAHTASSTRVGIDSGSDRLAVTSCAACWASGRHGRRQRQSRQPLPCGCSRSRAGSPAMSDNGRAGCRCCMSGRWRLQRRRSPVIQGACTSTTRRVA
jgi:hypothetical protein